MGFFIYSAEKLRLQRELNSKNYELQLISQRYQTVQQQIADRKEALGNMKESAKVANQYGATNFMQNEVRKALGDDQNLTKYKELQQKAMAGTLSADEQTKWNTVSVAVQSAQMSTTQMQSSVMSVVNSIFDSQEKAELAVLQAEQQSLDLKKASLEAQVQLAKGNLDAVTGKEKEEIGSSVPKYA